MKRLFPPLFLLANLGVCVYFFWQISMDLWVEGAPGRLIALGRLSGILLALLLMAQVIMISRARWLEQVYGLDSITRLHRLNGFCLFLLLLAHPLLLTAGYTLRNDVGFWAQAVDFFDNWDDVAEAMLGVAIIIVAGILWTFWGRRRLPYAWWYALHPLVYVGLYLSIEHQFETGPTATASPVFTSYWWFLYGFLVLNVAYYRLVRPVLLFWRYRFEILEIKRECEDVVSVLIGGKNIQAFKFAAGQFVSVRFLAKGFWWEEHPFSLSKAPGGDTLRLSIKAVGDFTRKVPQLISGTKILLDGPFGALTTARSKKDKVALYAGGIGITPLRALAEEFLQLGKKVTLFYGNRTQQGIALKAELDFLAAENRLQLFYVLSADPQWQGERGNIDREKISRLLPDFSDCDHYLCGPPPMMSKLEQTLKEMGVTTRYLHSERFAF